MRLRSRRCDVDWDCDGGGNRCLSNVDLRERPALKEFFLVSCLG